MQKQIGLKKEISYTFLAPRRAPRPPKLDSSIFRRVRNLEIQHFQHGSPTLTCSDILERLITKDRLGHAPVGAGGSAYTIIGALFIPMLSSTNTSHSLEYSKDSRVNTKSIKSSLTRSMSQVGHIAKEESFVIVICLRVIVQEGRPQCEGHQQNASQRYCLERKSSIYKV